MSNLNSIDFSQLAADLNTAVSAFLATNPVDGGTCNMDSTYVVPEGFRASSLVKKLEAVGIRTFVGKKWGKQITYICGEENRFQGCPRSKIAEITRDVLRKHGLQASVSYVID